MASSDDKRRRVAEQPRDQNGRWVSAGANVTWFSANQEWYGTIKEIRNGKAIVLVKHGNGKTSFTTLDPDTLRVTESKATLKPEPKEVETFKAFLDNNPELSSDKRIVRSDGYSLEIKKDKNSPYAYQIFSPRGISLGQYGEEAEDQLDSMVESDKSKNPVTASGDFNIVRVSRDAKSALIKTGDSYNALSIDTGEELLPGKTDFASLVASGSWRKVLPNEKNELTEKILTASGGIIIEGEEPKGTTYRVPNAVKEEISKALEFANDIPEEDLAVATTLSQNESVTRNEVEWINSFFSSYDVPQKLRGGYKGQKWANKILDPDYIEPAEFSANLDESLSYFAAGEVEGSTEANELLAVDYKTHRVYSWDKTEFTPLPEKKYYSVDRPQIVPVDVSTATAMANWLHKNDGEFNVADVDPIERNLFSLAESEMDFEELDRVTTLIADAGLVEPKKSVRAQRQQRGPSGTFKDGPISEPGKTLGNAFSKARVDERKVLKDPAKRIEQWKIIAKQSPIVAAIESPTEETMYFAIVDDVDKTAVLNVVAITKDEEENVHAWVRAESQWVEAPNLLADLQSATPPPVVELDVPEPAKSILTQVDAHDAGTDEDERSLVASVSDDEREKAAKKGFARPDGSYPIRNEKDLKNAVQAFGRAKESEKSEVKRHIRKRAKALNRVDLIPDSWRELSAVERGEELASQSPLYGEYGEVIVASGTPGVADTPEDFKNVRRLKNYWKYGAGAAKISWKTPGDLTRCHRHLSRYLGSDDAWGYCNVLHKELFGEWNPESGGK